MTKSVDERIGNMDKVLETLLPLASKYEKDIAERIVL